ncbi:UDP-glucose 4-epimerase GalE [Candidatus Adlerbacteria bacterium RIFCSPHIGHO2_12_FULL_53_18]|uniref:UDP-glucose 4-epimerase n=1 Tax=Candidatus Adlerbacteria bacterium RIFCSPHIGHO2_12_FULL_53_18 TaxID=1797242 RepID=A0A1F4XUA6_9BACT|nr:MAG: UDP-glucose 4-epimerase GalE [Candidatus Adlerbacteria bacterium RIFCSPHIGHO2_12_FULL_53_18]
MGTILVTGGAGYIGSHVAFALRERGEKVTELDLLINGDIRDRTLVSALLREGEVSAVAHLAACIDVEESVHNPKKYYDNNVHGTQILMEEVKRAGVACFVFSSTAAVYGTPATYPVAEDAPLRPENPYGESKVRAEAILHQMGGDIRYVILRYFNVAGINPKTQYRVRQDTTHLIRRVILSALGRRRVFEVYGTDYPTRDGTAIRDYVHVDDVAEAHIRALRYLRTGNPSAVWNVGYGRGYSVMEVVEMVKKVTGIDFPVEYAPRRPGDVSTVVADPTRLMRLGWQPKHNNLEEIIQSEYEWIRSNLSD